MYRNESLKQLISFPLGTTLIWANKVRFPSDLVFTEDFKNTFNTTLLAEMGEVYAHV